MKQYKLHALRAPCPTRNNLPPKYKDLGSPTISIVVGNSKSGHALVDLGASVNLLPYSVYVELGLGELEPTNITLQLADHSVKNPRGIVKDVLVQVDKFCFLVDFVVLDTQPVVNKGTKFPMILGSPFLVGHSLPLPMSSYTVGED